MIPTKDSYQVRNEETGKIVHTGTNDSCCLFVDEMIYVDEQGIAHNPFVIEPKTEPHVSGLPLP